MADVYKTFAEAVKQIYGGPIGGSFTLRRFVSHENVDDDGNLIPAVTNDLRVNGIVREKDIWNNGAFLGQQRIAFLDNKTAPFPDDQLIVGKDTFTVESVKTIAPNGVTIIRYEAVLR